MQPCVRMVCPHSESEPEHTESFVIIFLTFNCTLYEVSDEEKGKMSDLGIRKELDLVSSLNFEEGIV